MYNAAPARAGSCLYTFHGSCSCRYLLPNRATFMASFKASRNLKASNDFAILRPHCVIAAKASRSESVSTPGSCTTPSKYLCVSTITRFTKLPSPATNSLLLRVWKSAQVKSLSLVSGIVAVNA